MCRPSHLCHPVGATPASRKLRAGRLQRRRADVSSLDEVCRELVVTWTIGTAGIDAGLEGVLPEFSLRFQRPPQEFTFDAFSTPANESEWEWRAIRFSSLFEREFCFYLPISWRERDGDGFAASIHEGDQVRQSIFVADRPDWA